MKIVTILILRRIKENSLLKLTVFGICDIVESMNERSIIRATAIERIKGTTIADLPEGRTIILSGKPTAEGAIFKDKAPVVEKWTEEDEEGRTVARTVGKYATILYDTATREFSVILPDQEITGLRQSGIENDNYMILTAKESDEE